MGQTRRQKPAKLARKLRQIRLALGLSQNEMIDRLDLVDQLAQNNISAFERGTREPSLIVLLAYARTAGVCIDVLVDDGVDLPRSLPATPEHEGLRRQKRRPRR